MYCELCRSADYGASWERLAPAVHPAWKQRILRLAHLVCSTADPGPRGPHEQQRPPVLRGGQRAALWRRSGAGPARLYGAGARKNREPRRAAAGAARQWRRGAPHAPGDRRRRQADPSPRQLGPSEANRRGRRGSRAPSARARRCGCRLGTSRIGARDSRRSGSNRSRGRGGGAMGERGWRAARTPRA